MIEEYKSKEKFSKYYDIIRFDLIQIIPNNSDAILEVGAGRFATLNYLKQSNLTKYAAGVELMRFEDSYQFAPAIDLTIIGDVEKDQIPLQYNFYDTILFPDVLEHLVDPWGIINKYGHYLKDNGTIITSLPNIRYYQIMYKIFFNGNFGYTNNGIMDKTHLRFFCKKNMKDLIEESSFTISRIIPSFKLQPNQKRNRILNFITLGLLEEFFAKQYIIIASKM